MERNVALAVYTALPHPNITGGRVGRGNAGYPRPKGRGSGTGLFGLPRTQLVGSWVHKAQGVSRSGIVRGEAPYPRLVRYFDVVGVHRADEARTRLRA